MNFWMNALSLALIIGLEIFKVMNFCILNVKYYLDNNIDDILSNRLRI